MKKTIVTLLIAVLLIPLFVPQQAEASQKDSQIIMDAYNWVCEDVWNNYFCDMYHYIESGTGSLGQKLNAKKCIKNGKKVVKKVAYYDAQMKKLSNTKKNKKAKEIWKKLKKEIIMLDKQLQEKTPKANDESYIFNTDKFQTYMYKLLDYVY
ncbi:hypothetical protein [Velocimicrobium porci]|uniref:Uncharacterized protein n=1 Tax=Velocimicrobium porci TaxID=2606634 RepID=A0A6L5Y0Z5_9FIRM|nr:hypothetical protein [Velocimicrobium porci]MSS64604.1 hypothetical protein [Velocimicrobium porci]DAN97716.1 MAG TPA: hypothetical protein [Caudoviricetes sp.]